MHTHSVGVMPTAYRLNVAALSGLLLLADSAVGGTLASSPGRDPEQSPRRATDVRQGQMSPLMRRVTIKKVNASVADVIGTVRTAYHIPIIFVDASVDSIATPTLTIALNNGTLEELLNQIVRAAPAYTYEVIGKRIVLYPHLPKYSAKLNLQIHDRRRLDAAYEFAEALNQQVPGFADLAGPPVLGDDRQKLFSEAVSLEGESRVVEHLANLAGRDESVTLSIVRARTGVPVLVLESVG